MLLLLLVTVGSAVPVPLINQTHHNQTIHPKHPNLRPVVQLSNRSLHNQTNHTLTFPRLTLLSSELKATNATQRTPSSKVEEFAKKLRADLEAQERVLHSYVATIQRKHASVEMNLKRVKSILKGLKDEIANATSYATQYQAQENEQVKQSTLISSEYDKSMKMYQTEKSNLKFEREFLDAIIRYIQLRKNAKC